jgi:hypothetical protein
LNKLNKTHQLNPRTKSLKGCEVKPYYCAKNKECLSAKFVVVVVGEDEDLISYFSNKTFFLFLSFTEILFLEKKFSFEMMNCFDPYFQIYR